MMKNPFSLAFGKSPINYIERVMQKNEIINSFSEDNPPYQVCMVTGVRGAGKTVILTEIARYFREEEKWIVIDLSPERDLMQTMAAQLSNTSGLISLFRDAKINLSFLGLGIEMDGVPPITDVSVAIDRMLEHIGKCKKKVLITVDEVTSNEYIREFVSEFQIYMRKDYPVFLLMTGLFENIYELQNEKSLTFLYRAPKVDLRPLNEGMIANKYEKIFSITRDEAMAMARETKGYPFAFQVLGYLCWKNKTKWTENLDEYSQYLEEYVYEKLWSEMSVNDKQVVVAIAQSNNGRVSNIRELSDKSSANFSVYRDRLIKKGIITAWSYGYLEFSLPRFKEFVLKKDI
ncbi:MAG: DUF2075 domain-containing protein [Thermoflexaceae bacterium]|nr:DUF2075 domain-containing protein [Thermoflexaceae bacterium]